jgi:hypothetical protein
MPIHGRSVRFWVLDPPLGDNVVPFPKPHEWARILARRYARAVLSTSPPAREPNHAGPTDCRQPDTAAGIR